LNSIDISTNKDLQRSDYVITDFNNNIESLDDGYKRSTLTIDFLKPYVVNKRLSWVVLGPLDNKSEAVYIKDIKIIFHKKGWLS
jgi:hypothetical protein